MPPRAAEPGRLPITWLGLGLAILGPPLVALEGQSMAQSIDPLLVGLMGQATLCLIVVGVLAIVRYEGRPLASIGLVRPTWGGAAIGLALAGAFVLVVAPIQHALVAWIGTGGFEDGLTRLRRLPVWYRLLAIGVGVVLEEICYRGYAIERLGWLGGNVWLGAAFATVLFAGAHVPFWGPVASLTFLLPATVTAVVYVWRRDLTPLLIAHAATDTIGIVLG